MQRREFITLLGGTAVTWPLGARAQQLPLIGALSSGAPSSLVTEALAQGLKETGYVERQNVLIEYRWASGAYHRLPILAAELLDLRPSVLLTFGTPAARIAKQVSLKTSGIIPVIFSLGSDPVAEGLVKSLSRPSGNMTGVTSISGELSPKRIEFLRELLGDQVVLALMVNPDNPLSRAESDDAERAARTLGQQLSVITARNENEIDTAFRGLKERSIAGLIIAVDTFYFGQMRRMAALAIQHRVPAVGPLRDFALAGGLMTYGASIFDVNRQAAVYVGKVLNGAKTADLPVMQPTKFELLINLKAAKALNVDIPPSLLARADEVIE